MASRLWVQSLMDPKIINEVLGQVFCSTHTGLVLVFHSIPCIGGISLFWVFLRMAVDPDWCFPLHFQKFGCDFLSPTCLNSYRNFLVLAHSVPPFWHPHLPVCLSFSLLPQQLAIHLLSSWTVCPLLPVPAICYLFWWLSGSLLRYISSA